MSCEIRAKVVTSFTYPADCGRCGIVVSESGIKQVQTRLRGRADRAKPSLVTSEWLAQCLIHAELQDWSLFMWPRELGRDSI